MRAYRKIGARLCAVCAADRDALGGLAAVAAQTADDAARLSILGAKNVSVMGNLKFDIEPPPAMLELGRQLREQFGAGRRIFLAASTRDGEEALLLDALQQVHIPGLLLVIVPRHPQRFAEIAALLEQRGIPFRRRSEIRRQNGVIPQETRAVLATAWGRCLRITPPPISPLLAAACCPTADRT